MSSVSANLIVALFYYPLPHSTILLNYEVNFSQSPEISKKILPAKISQRETRRRRRTGITLSRTSQRGALGTMDKGAKDVAKMTSLPPSVMI
jgi:hypothetical protein